MQTAIQRGWNMRKVKANRQKLLTAVTANYEKHKKAYAEAFEGYKLEAADAVKAVRRKVIRASNALAKKVAEADREKGQKPVPVHLPMDLLDFELRPPVDHSSDYEVVIEMLSYEVADEVEIEQGQFEAYVMDRWSWKDEFVASHATYSNKLNAPAGAARR